MRRSAFLGAPAALLLAALASSCSGPTPVEPGHVRRLIELTPRVLSPSPLVAPAELGFKGPSIPGLPQSPRLASGHRPTQDGTDVRDGFFGPAGEGYRFVTTIRSGAELRVGIAAWAAPAAGHTVTFRAVVRDDSGGEAKAEATASSADDARWAELVVDAAALAPGRAVIELRSQGPAGAWAGWGAPVVSWREARRRPDVILISLDTLRADHLGSYGYTKRATSPALDRFAERSIRFADAVSQAPWTRPSHRTMFSSRYPSFQQPTDDFLASLLWRRQYRTLGIAGGGQMDKQFGFSQGFESYRADQWIHRPQQVLDAIAEHPGRDLFLLLHTYEIHDPYTDQRFAGTMPRGRAPLNFSHRSRNRIRRNTTAEEKAFVEALYDGDLAYTDAQLGDLFARFEREGVFERSIVLITSDHGEEFWEHGGWRHGQSLYEEQLHVPFLLWLPPELRRRFAPAFPEGRPAVVEDQVGVIDIVPTLFELLGLDPPPGMQGRSVVPLLRGEKLPERPLLAEKLYIARVEKKSLRTDRLKLILPVGKRTRGQLRPGEMDPELYDLRRDPDEADDLAKRYPEIVEKMKGGLESLLTGATGGIEETTPEDAQLRKDLEALGYIGG